MDEKKKKKKEVIEDETQQQETEATEPTTLIEKEIVRFNEIVAKDPQRAYSRYGYSLLCSLPPEQMAREVLRLRKRTDDPFDLYNRGVFEAQDGKPEKALKDFQKSYAVLAEMDEATAVHYLRRQPTFLADLAFNLYLCHCEQDQKSEGKKEFKQVQKLAKGLYPDQETSSALWEAFAEVESEL
ncbi:MAG TPA: hypothetical protein PKH07_15310 [bacterium]|nr:hypothetical protein [bacterium]